jgi:hypothetical protein
VLFHTGLSAGRNLLRNGIQVVLAHLGLYRSSGLRRTAFALGATIEIVGMVLSLLVVSARASNRVGTILVVCPSLLGTGVLAYLGLYRRSSGPLRAAFALGVTIEIVGMLLSLLVVSTRANNRVGAILVVCPSLLGTGVLAYLGLYRRSSGPLRAAFALGVTIEIVGMLLNLLVVSTRASNRVGAILVVCPSLLGTGVLALGLYRRSSGLRRAADFANVIHKGVLGDLHRCVAVEAVLAVGLPVDALYLVIALMHTRTIEGMSMTAKRAGAGLAVTFRTAAGLGTPVAVSVLLCSSKAALGAGGCVGCTVVFDAHLMVCFLESLEHGVAVGTIPSVRYAITVGRCNHSILKMVAGLLCLAESTLVANPDMLLRFLLIAAVLGSADNLVGHPILVINIVEAGVVALNGLDIGVLSAANALGHQILTVEMRLLVQASIATLISAGPPVLGIIVLPLARSVAGGLDGLLRNQDLTTLGALLAIGQTVLGAGSSLALDGLLGVALGLDGFLLNRDLTADGALLAIGQTGLGAGSGIAGDGHLGVVGGRDSLLPYCVATIRTDTPSRMSCCSTGRLFSLSNLILMQLRILFTSRPLICTTITNYPLATATRTVADTFEAFPLGDKYVVRITMHSICTSFATAVVLMRNVPPLVDSERSSRQQAHTHDKRNEQGENAFAKVLVMFHRFNSFLCLIYGCKVSGGRAGIARQRRSPHSFASRHFWRFANYKVVISNRLP